MAGLVINMAYVGDRIILDLCGGSGAWAAPYRDSGYSIITIDLDTTGQDIRKAWMIPERVHGILAAPPCKHLAHSGARWWETKGPTAYLEAISIVDACLRFVAIKRPQWWVLENPKGRITKILGPPRHTFNPCDYGDPYTKLTYLWGAFNIPEPAPVAPTMRDYIKNMPDSKGRDKRRSITPPGFAQAFYKANP